MPLFEVETTSHIMIACAEDETDGSRLRDDALSDRRDHPGEPSPARCLGDLQEAPGHPDRRETLARSARDCLSKAQGDKLHAVRLYMQKTGTDLEGARKVIESNMATGVWWNPGTGST